MRKVLFSWRVRLAFGRRSRRTVGRRFEVPVLAESRAEAVKTCITFLGLGLPSLVVVRRVRGG